MSSKYWKLPLNWKELLEAVKWAAGGQLSLEVNAPDSAAIVAELMDQPAANRRLVHLVNYAGPQGKSITGVEVSVELPQGKHLRVVSLLSPDGNQSQAVPARVEQGQANFTVPRLDTYTLAVLELD